MNFQLYEYHNFDKSIFFDFLKKEFYHSNDKAKINMWHDNWQDHNHTLPYLLEISERFKEPKGAFNILIMDDHIVGCGGVYISNFNKNVSLCGTRLWVTKEYRNRSLLRETIFPAHKKWSIEKNCKIAAFCFNEYNKSFTKTFFRKRIGEKNERISNRKPYHLFYNGAIEVEFPVRIQNTKQWVIYEQLDRNFNFDWGTIKF